MDLSISFCANAYKRVNVGRQMLDMCKDHPVGLKKMNAMFGSPPLLLMRKGCTLMWFWDFPTFFRCPFFGIPNCTRVICKKLWSIRVDFPSPNYLVGGIPTPSQNICQLGWLSLMYRNPKKNKPPTGTCFSSTNKAFVRFRRSHCSSFVACRIKVKMNMPMGE